MTTKQQDRVSFGITVPGPEQYSSRRFDIQTDALPGETAAEAMERAVGFIMGLVGDQLPAPAPIRSARPPIDDELFDPSNPVHFRIATAILDELKVKSRDYKLNVLMKGQRIRDLAAIVRQDMEDARRKQPARRWPS